MYNIANYLLKWGLAIFYEHELHHRISRGGRRAGLAVRAVARPSVTGLTTGPIDWDEESLRFHLEKLQTLDPQLVELRFQALPAYFPDSD